MTKKLRTLLIEFTRSTHAHHANISCRENLLFMPAAYVKEANTMILDQTAPKRTGLPGSVMFAIKAI